MRRENTSMNAIMIAAVAGISIALFNSSGPEEAAPARFESFRPSTSPFVWRSVNRSATSQRSRRDRQRAYLAVNTRGQDSAWIDEVPRSRSYGRAPVRVAALNGWGYGLQDPGPARRYARSVGRSHASTACLPASIRGKLASVEARFGPIQVISTHRPGARIRGTGRPSYHASCRAADFRPRPGTYGAVIRYLRSTWDGGVGSYRSGHIHIDNGPRIRFAGR